MKINVRGLVKELLENENLIVNYNELNNGGFDLSVRINEEAVNRAEIKTESTINPITTCPHCGSKNVQFMWGTALMTTNKSELSHHYLCRNCLEEFDK